MSFQVLNFATIRICTSDVQKCLDWVRDFFRAEPVESFESFASFRIAEVTLDIVLADEKSPVSTGSSVGYWLVDELDQAIEKATALGGRVYRGPMKVDEIQRTIVQILIPGDAVIGLEAPF